MRRFLSRLVPGTLDGKISILIAVVLLATVLCVWIARWLGRDNVAVHHAISFSRMFVEFLLAIVIPFLIYWGLRWWNQAETPLFPDIDQAWQAGMDALAALGISIDDLPIFLVLGSTDSSLEREFVAGAISDLRIEGVPHDPNVRHALHWYATSDAIYLFCTHIGVLSSVARQWAKHRPAEGFIRTALPRQMAGGAPLPGQRHTPAGGTPSDRGDANAGAAFGSPADEEENGSEDSVFVGSFANLPVSRSESPALVEPSRADVSAGVVSAERGHVGEHVLPGPSSPSMTVPRIPEIERTRQLERLKYVCQLLRVARSPRCGINGLLTLLPIEISMAGEEALDDLSSVARKDVETVQDELALLAPVTGMVIGFERERGFAEFFNRLPAEYRHGRLGSGFDLETYPTSEMLNEHSDRLCDRVEERIYDLFRGRDAIAGHRGNRKLYNLLCRIRHHLKPNLRIVLGKAFGCAPDRQLNVAGGSNPPLLFSGCYFAAVGGITGGSAFTRGVLIDKLLSEQGKVQWSEPERRRHSFLRVSAWIGVGVFVALFASLGFQLVFLRHVTAWIGWGALAVLLIGVCIQLARRVAGS